MQWRVIEDAYKNGIARAIGVSNFDCARCMECIMNSAIVRPMVNQIYLHVGMAEVYGVSRFHDVVIQSFSPLMRGELFNSTLLEQLARKLNRSVAQLALKWLNQHKSPFVTTSRKHEHLKQNLAIFDWNISTHDMRLLDKVVFDDYKKVRKMAICEGRLSGPAEGWHVPRSPKWI